jgi:hypothetical protein
MHSARVFALEVGNDVAVKFPRKTWGQYFTEVVGKMLTQQWL